MPYALIGLITLVLWIYCLVDVVTCPEDAVRNLPKVLWLLVVLLLPTIGSILWLVIGRPLGEPIIRGIQRGREFTEYERPARQAPLNPDDDADFLRKIRERAEEQRREAQRQREANED